jgi:hypothetical protein
VITPTIKGKPIRYRDIFNCDGERVIDFPDIQTASIWLERTKETRANAVRVGLMRADFPVNKITLQ